jgi:hypothetical protein
MTVGEILEQTWKTVLAEASQAEGYYHRRIPVPSAWPAHAGIRRPAGSRILVLETESSVVRGFGLKDNTRGYAIDVGQDEAGRTDRAAICIEEASRAYGEIFTVFCADILEHWIPHAGVSESLQSLIHRLARWKRFFQRGNPLGLSREDHIGLYGELCFIEAGLKSGCSATLLLNAWQAPLGTSQDFLFGAVAAEIKTNTGIDMDLVRITNARQLDSTGLQTLFLARYAFDFRNGSGRTLRQIISSLRAELSASSTDALAILEDRLLDAGFVESVPNEFDAWGFTFRQFDVFDVGDGFPRVLETDLPHGISEISYALNLGAAAAFRCAESVVWEGIISNHG